MAFDIQTFKSAFADGGARPTFYDVQVTFPAVADAPDIPGADGGAAAAMLKFTAVGASLPESRLGTIEIPYFGRTIKVEGNKVYPDWTISVINDEGFTVRSALEAWHDKIDSITGNLMAVDFANGNYKASALVTQYSKLGQTAVAGANEGNIIRTYELVGMFPTLIGDIRLGYDRVNALEDYTVTFALDWWTLFESNSVLPPVGSTPIPGVIVS